MKLFKIIGLILLSLPLYAEPVYLKCVDVSDNADKSDLFLKVDEAPGKVTVSHDDGASNYDAFFNPNSIKYGSRLMVVPPEVEMITTNELDRTTLQLTQTIVIEQTDYARSKFLEKQPETTEKSRTVVKKDCSIVENKERKI